MMLCCIFLDKLYETLYSHAKIFDRIFTLKKKRKKKKKSHLDETDEEDYY